MGVLIRKVLVTTYPWVADKWKPFVWAGNRVFLEIPSGPLQGRWTFYPIQRPEPWAIIRTRVSSGSPYSADVEIYCRDKGCPLAELELARLEAPFPFEAGDAVQQEWQTIALNEACAPGKISRTPPIYPPEEKIQFVEGKSKLLLLYNPCGTVRMSYLLESSGNRNLDHAALLAVKTWRIPTQTPGQGGLSKVDIVFDPRTAP